MSLLRYSLVATAAALAVYGVTLLGAAWIFKQTGVTRTLDVGSQISDVVFGTSGLSAVVYNRLPLSRGGRRFVLIGASNVVAIPATNIAERVHGAEVDNMSISGSMPRDWSRLIDLAYEAIPPGARPQTTFVAGVWYGSFMSGEPAQTGNLDAELTRFALYARDPADSSVALQIPRGSLAALLAALEPIILETRFWNSFASQNSNAVTAIVSWSRNAGGADEFGRDQVVVDTAAQHAFMLQMRRAAARPLAPGAFEALKAEAETVSRNGGRFVIVDLPLPSWHAKGVKEYGEYQTGKWRFFKEILKTPGVSYINFQNGISDDDFYDSVHPKPEAAKIWARRLGDILMHS